MKQSERKLRKILELDKPLKYRIIDSYLEHPIISDVVISSIIVSLFIFTSKWNIFQIEVESLNDILNELISSSLSAGGFVLAALAIIASIKQDVQPISNDTKPQNGKEYFYNSVGYPKVVNLYSVTCLIFLIVFVYFVILRANSSGIKFSYLVYHLVFSISIASLTFLRCVLVLWAVIRIK